MSNDEHGYETVLTGHEMVDTEGERIGVVDDVIFDNETHEPKWAVLRRGMLHRSAFVPLRHARRTASGQIAVPYDRHLVAAAPKVPRSHVLTTDDERAIRAHYGL